MRVRSVLLIIGVALIAAAPATAAPPVLGPADGVQATLADGALIVRFTGDPARWTPLVGREISASCTRDPDTTRLLFVDTPDGFDDIRGLTPEKPAADGTLRFEVDADERYDSCDLSGFDAHGGRPLLARAAVTPRGATWIDESLRATALHALLDRATDPDGYRPLAALGAGVVALDGPDGTPAPGQTAYWTDGTRASVATLSATGRRLVIEDLGRGVVRSNVLEQSDAFARFYDDAKVVKILADDFIVVRQDAKARSPYRGRRPLTRADGVRAGAAGRRVRFRFAGRAATTFHALAGRRIAAVCLTRPAPSPFPPLPTSAHARRATARVPRHGDAVAFTLSGPPGDLCVLADHGTRVAVAALTTTGERWRQDIRALGLFVTNESSDPFAPSGATSYWPTATVVARGRKVLVAMSGPDARVPVGRVGVWTDGARQGAEATTSVSGTRFVAVDEGDGMERTNVFGVLNLWVLLLTDPSD